MSRPPVSKWFAALCGWIFICSPHTHADPATDLVTEQVRSIFQRAQGAVVRIEAVDDHGRLAGSGFFIDPNGTLYTSYTVGGETRDIVVCNGEMKYPATRLVADQRSGIAILKVEAATPFLPLGRSSELGVASMVVAVGYPMDFPVTPSFGVVGGFNLKYLGRYFATAHIRANLTAQRGEGGAPLLNMHGEAVGVLISNVDHGSGCFALPIEAAEKVRSDYMHYGEVRPGWLGIKVGEANQEVSKSNAEVQGLVENAPAAGSKLVPGDIITQIGERKVSCPEDVLNAAFYLTAGNEVPLTIVRNGETMELKVEAGEHPSSPRKTAQAPPTVPGIPLRLEH